MLRFLIVSEEQRRLEGLRKGLLTHFDVQIVTTGSAFSALDHIASGETDLVIVDDEVSGHPGKALIERMIRKNPMINTALVSGLNDGDFHEYTEGLGVLMRIPKDPGSEVAEEVIGKLERLILLSK